MSEQPMSFAERIGRIVLFPIALIEWYFTKQSNNTGSSGGSYEPSSHTLSNGANEMKIAQEAEIARMAAVVEQAAERARFRCQLVYDRLAHRIKDRFSQEKLEAYFEKYMNDSLTPELIESRGRELESLLNSLAGHEDEEKPTAPSKIQAFFQKQRDEIEVSQIADELKEKLIAEINFREDQAIMEALRSQ